MQQPLSAATAPRAPERSQAFTRAPYGQSTVSPHATPYVFDDDEEDRRRFALYGMMPSYVPDAPSAPPVPERPQHHVYNHAPVPHAEPAPTSSSSYDSGSSSYDGGSSSSSSSDSGSSSCDSGGGSCSSD